MGASGGVDRMAVFGCDLVSAAEAVERHGFILVERDPQVILCHGGDGTLLRAEREWPGVPKLPIRVGSRARLCAEHGLDAALSQLAAGELDHVQMEKLELRIGPRVFLASTTHGAETHGLAAAQAALDIFRNEPVIDHMWRIGGTLIEQLNGAARDAGVGESFEAYGYPCSPAFICRDASGNSSFPLRTLFLQEMIRGGVIMAYIAPSYAHTEDSVAITVDAARAAFAVYRRALDRGWESLLEGPPIRPVFRQWN